MGHKGPQDLSWHVTKAIKWAKLRCLHIVMNEKSTGDAFAFFYDILINPEMTRTLRSKKNLWWFYWYLDLSTHEHQPNQTGWSKTILLPKGWNLSLKFRRAFHSSSLSCIFYWYVHPLTHDTYTSWLHLYPGLVCEIFLPFNFSQFSAVMALLIQVALSLFSRQIKVRKKMRQSQMPGFTHQLPHATIIASLYQNIKLQIKTWQLSNLPLQKLSELIYSHSEFKSSAPLQHPLPPPILAISYKFCFTWWSGAFGMCTHRDSRPAGANRGFAENLVR